MESFQKFQTALMNSTVTAVESCRILGTTISQYLKWDNHIESIVEKAQQRLFFLRQLRNLPQELLKQFYSAIIEFILFTSITVWFSSATKSDLRRLRSVVRIAEWIIGTTTNDRFYFKSSEAMQQLCERIGEDFQQIMMSILVCCSHTAIVWYKVAIWTMFMVLCCHFC